jgi:hypothetical protein
MPSLKDAILRIKPEMFKKLGDVEVEGINEIIFTGTGLDYLRDSIKKNGFFKHSEGRKVYLSNKVGGAYAPAINRSHSYHDDPVVLAVDSRYQDSAFNLRREGIQKDIVCEQIPREAIRGVFKVRNLNNSDLLFVEDELDLLRSRCEEVVL